MIAMTDPSVQLDNLRVRIRTSGEIEDEDRERLLDFDDRLTLLNSDYSDYRHLKLLRHCTIIAEEVGGLHAALIDRKTAEEIVRWINREYENEETNQDYRVALKVFGRRVTDEGVQNDPDEPPISLAWVPSTTSKNYDPAPNPAEMLGWEEDVVPMIEETNNLRDAAAIALQFDAGLRGFEFEDMTVGNITDHQYGLQVTVDGKQGRRTVTLIPSVPYITEWLDNHPAGREGKSAPLWSKLETPEPISYRMKSKMFKEPAKRAGIDKPITLTNFRKSSASYYASKGMSQSHLEARYGWVTGSSAASRYISVFGAETANEVARIHGMEVSDEDTDRIARVVCPRCDEPNTHQARFCMRCGQALSAEAVQQLDDIDTGVKEEYRQADPEDEETHEAVDAIERALKDPEMRQMILERIDTDGAET